MSRTSPAEPVVSTTSSSGAGRSTSRAAFDSSRPGRHTRQKCDGGGVGDRPRVTIEQIRVWGELKCA